MQRQNAELAPNTITGNGSTEQGNQNNGAQIKKRPHHRHRRKKNGPSNAEPGGQARDPNNPANKSSSDSGTEGDQSARESDRDSLTGSSMSLLNDRRPGPRNVSTPDS